MRRWGLSGGVTAFSPSGVNCSLSAQQQRLLAVLLIARGRVVSAATIEDRLWSRHSSASAGSVRVAINRLRAQLGETAPIETIDGGYRLDAADDSVDVWRFEKLVKQSLVDDDLTRAIASIEAAQ